MKKNKLSDAGLLFSSAVYSEEAVRLAAFVFSSREEVRTRKEAGGTRAVLPAGNEELEGAFANEVLNQQCRLDLARKNSKVAGIIVTKALLSAMGERG
ncbi:MAG: hypothetical protein RQ748_04525 [Elusimicrobiales bacterium]|nr:hypothetical protein [Elusimicrobiales bacterium]